MKKNKVLVVGLDCATFHFIRPYAQEGWLPNLNRIMNQGVTRILKSTVPPVSPPAWTTFLTGKNPGQHGIFQFVDMDVRNYGFISNRIINSSLFSGNTFVDFVSDQNLRVGIVKIPFTYPPWKVNGFMIAGDPSPDWTKAHTYPPELSESIGRVNIGNSTDFMRYNTEDLVKHLRFDCNVRTKISCDMLENEPYDLFVVVHNITDAAVHRFWKFMDKTCPNYKESFSKYRNLIRDIYVEADKSIGKILEKIGDDTILFVMSDHGASRKPLYFFHTNAWLKQMGYLEVKREKSHTEYINTVLTKIKNMLPSVARHLIIHFIKMRFLDKLSDFQTRTANFDWPKTKAYAVSLYTTYDGIVLNLKGRQPYGIIEPGSEAKSICDELYSALLELKDPRTGQKVVDRVYRREEVFQGDFAGKMPELIIQYNKDYRNGKNTTPPLFSDVLPSDFDFQSGDHDENGIFLASGPNIRQGVDCPSAKIQDMAPTILYALGLPVPDDMDGEVLLDIFEKDFLDNNAINRVSRKKLKALETFQLDKDEEEQIKEQLKGLGYM